MKWKAKIIDVRDVGNGTADVTIRYKFGDKEFSRSYNIHAQSYQTPQSFEDFIRSELTSLTLFEDVYASIESLIDIDISLDD